MATGRKKDSRACGIYARISQDRAAGAAGVSRQVRACRERAESLGWEVVDEYIDNDVSAYGQKPRPEYERLLEDMQTGRIRGVVAWHPDRIYRRLQDLEQFTETCGAFGVEVETIKAGRVDLATASGRASAQMLGVWANFESSHKAERVTAAMRERAERGLHHGGQRPFGYEKDGMTLRESEASLAREAVERFIAGHSISAIARWLEDEGARTVTGRDTWRLSVLRQLLRSARLSGQVEYRGVILGPAQWPAIVTPEQTAAVRAILADPSRRQKRKPRRYLLSGLLICHRCGSPMTGETKRGVGKYSCRRTHARPDACAGTSIQAEPVEALISGALLSRLDSAQLRAAEPTIGNGNALEQEREARNRLDALAAMLGDGSLDAESYRKAADKAYELLDNARAAQAASAYNDQTRNLLNRTGSLRDAWPDLTLTQQRRIVDAILDHATIHEGKRGARFVDPSRVRAVWKA